MIESGAVGIVGGTNDLTTGVVNFYNDTLIINNSEYKPLQEESNNLPEVVCLNLTNAAKIYRITLHYDYLLLQKAQH